MEFISKSYTEEGIYIHNSKARCELEYRSSFKNLAELIEKVKKEPKLADGQAFKIAIKFLEMLNSDQLENPDMFENVFVMLNSLPLLQLKNYDKMELLNCENLELNQNFLTEDDIRNIKAGICTRENFWDNYL